MPEEHRIYLGDRSRLEAYGRALARVVAPGAVVLDLGAGTGILGLLACRAGAGRVYAVDEGPILEFARRVARANGLEERFRFVRGMSTRVDLPERVGVVVADLIGGFGLEAGILEYFADARERFLAPGGVLVPSAVTVELAAVEHAALHAGLDFWDGRPADFDLGPLRAAAANSPAWEKIRPEALLGPQAALPEVDLATAGPGPLSGDLVLPVARKGTLHAIGGWFRAVLAPGVAISTCPHDPRRLDRRNVLLPLDRAVAVAPGDRVEVRLDYHPFPFLVAWRGRVVGGDGREKGVFSQSTFHADSVSPADLRGRTPGFVPRPDRFGAAWRRAVLLCDGNRTVAAIRDALREEFPGLFRSERDLEGLVADAVASVAPPGSPGAPAEGPEAGR